MKLTNVYVVHLFVSEWYQIIIIFLQNWSSDAVELLSLQ